METRSNHDHEPTVDLQIVGAGLAGLLAANLAIDAGLSVRLIERRSNDGGRAASVNHHGYLLNVGPHALYLQGELRQALLGLGLDPAGTPPDTKGATGSIGGRVGLLPLGPGSLLRTELLGPRAKLDTAKLLARIPRIDPAELATTTAAEWIAGSTRSADARTLIHGIVNLTTYNPAADLASADAVVAQLQMALDEGVHYIDDGWGSIVAKLADRAERRGLQRVEATVRRVTTATDATGATGVTRGTVASTVDGPDLRATTCLLAAGGPAIADRLLGLDGVNVDRAGPAVEASVLDLGLRRRPPVGAHLGLDRRLYATVHSVATGLAPAGRHLVGVARYRLPGDTSTPEETRAVLVDHATEMGIDPADIGMDRYLHRLTVAAGMPLADRGGLAGRPTVEAPERPGVFLAGDWVGPRGLLADAAAASATDAVAAITARLAEAGAPSIEPDGRATLVGR